MLGAEWVSFLDLILKWGLRYSVVSVCLYLSLSISPSSFFSSSTFPPHPVRVGGEPKLIAIPVYDFSSFLS